MKSKLIQRGFTLPELLLTIWFFVVCGIIGTVCYVVWHFISKFW